jgi:hypothetical protein
VSLAKSSIYFSPNTHVIMRAEICDILHIDTEALSDKYLGLPAKVVRIPIQVLESYDFTTL